MTVESQAIRARRTQKLRHDRVVGLVREVAVKLYRSSYVAPLGKFLPKAEEDRFEKLERRGIQPDAWLRIPNGWLVVFEVWGQGEAFEKATYELFRISRRLEVRGYNIICLTGKKGGDWDRRKAYGLAKTVLDNVKETRLRPKQVRVAEVNLDALHDDRRIKESIRAQLERPTASSIIT